MYDYNSKMNASVWWTH